MVEVVAQPMVSITTMQLHAVNKLTLNLDDFKMTAIITRSCVNLFLYLDGVYFRTEGRSIPRTEGVSRLEVH